ncbi:hypothetical protein CPHO_08270 [Corynebacterium phocae]|uniref:Uncharacterized protein n=1 Tax=Corynebacterium phocae TaxID=161895 RepID=A0A1L7D4E6_9CORY|nr:hypothetical protein [Corynebacterium phocae]APT92881.1 hypothetical protein CPHO_08270 [Corynebacterium phocae]KAA8723203.1 hypothetical protein F4V58_07775 [Corynebacterium phocae]
MTTEIEFINPIQEYVLRPQSQGGWLKVTDTNTTTAVGEHYMPLPKGNLELVLTWTGRAGLWFFYLPDGVYDSRVQAITIPAQSDRVSQTARVSLPIDSDEAKCYASTGAGQNAYRAGLKIIRTNFTT